MTTTPPQLRRPQFHVWMHPDADDRAVQDGLRDPDEPTYHGIVTIRHSDQLRAELESAKLGLPSPKVAPMMLTTVWVWAAMVRTGDYRDRFPKFRHEDLAELQPVDRDDDEQEGDAEDPTQPGHSSDSV